jgi:hypothetical protein
LQNFRPPDQPSFTNTESQFVYSQLHAPSHASAVLDEYGNEKIPSYIKLRIDNQTYISSHHSGAEVTILPHTAVVDYDLQPCNTQVFAANGTTIAIIGTIELTAFVEDHPVIAKAIVSKQVKEILLGVPFFRHNNVLPDYNAGTASKNGCITSLHVRPRKGWCRRAILASDVELPPRTESVVPAQVQFNGRFIPSSSAWINDIN